jgi:hypothetical protein
MRLGALGVAGLLALFLIWQGVRGHGPAPTAAAAPAGQGSSPGQPAALASAGRDTAAPVAPPAGQAASVEAESAPSPARAAQAPANPSVAITPGPDSTNKVSVKNARGTSPPGPPAIRLQAIVFHPTRPSAMINGKTLFVGDMLGEMRLMAIGRESVTLVGGGQTNLLTLR